MTTTTIATLAAEANSFLYRDAATDRVLKKDGTPQWVTDLCFTAHNGMMPDDWKFEFIQDALNALEDTDNPEEVEPDVDSLYPYTHDRLKWLASHLDRPGYCDEAMEEFGGEFKDTVSLIALGMYWELSAVFGSVRQSLEDRLEKISSEEE